MSATSHLNQLACQVANQGPWDQKVTADMLHGPPALPMPVKVADPATLIPVFKYLERQRDASFFHDAAAAVDETFMPGQEPHYQTPFIEYEKGVIYVDRRLDLCKMVVGPTNIRQLMDSLNDNQFIEHFLLGNNIIGPVGARAIAGFIQKHPDRMQTWYLAGNCIDKDGFQLISQALQNSQASNLWFKRNPLGPTSVSSIVDLLLSHGCPRTLDLDQTELSDQGVAAIFDGLNDHAAPIALRHLYLNGTGAGPAACESISLYLASGHCAIQSIYLGMNPIGDVGAVALGRGLQKNQSLERLMLLSVGMTSTGANAILAAAAEHSTLTSLDLGQSYATNDLDVRYNWLTDESIPFVCALLDEAPVLRYLNLSHTSISHKGLNAIEEAITRSNTLCYAFVKSVLPATGSHETVRARLIAKRTAPQVRDRLHSNVARLYQGIDYETFVANEKRWLCGPKEDLRRIDSVYRNRDMGLARHGIKPLDKWWDEDDQTLQEIMAA